jgi:single-strand DNA-binding protein
MPNQFIGTGNLADAPSLKRVTVDGDERAVANLRIFFDEYSRDDHGEFTQRGGLWFNVSAWDQLAENAARLLRKGARVRIEGRLKAGQWIDKDTGETRPTIEIVADDITLKLGRIESVTFRAARPRLGSQEPEPNPSTNADPPAMPPRESADPPNSSKKPSRSRKADTPAPTNEPAPAASA